MSVVYGMLGCRICGLVVAYDQVHIKWHMDAGDWNDYNCPWDGSPIGQSSAGPEGGFTAWACGHAYQWQTGVNNG